MDPCQPLTSEDDIRREALSARPEPLDQREVTHSPASSPGGDTNTESAEGYEPGGFITEPLARQSHNVMPDLRSSSPAPSPQKNIGRKILTLILSFLVIGALGVGAYYYFFSGKLAAADLTKTTAQNTTYSYPKEWKSLPLGIGIETYTNSSEGG